MVPKFSFLAWTTTPWTLPSNLGLSVGANIDYVLVQTFNPYTHLPVNVILAKALFSKYFENSQNLSLNEGDAEFFTNIDSKKRNYDWKIIKTFKGRDIEGAEYEQLLPFEAHSLEQIREITSNAEAFKLITGD